LKTSGETEMTGDPEERKKNRQIRGINETGPTLSKEAFACMAQEKRHSFRDGEEV